MILLRGSRILSMFRGIPGKRNPMDTWEITQALRAEGYPVTEAGVSRLLTQAKEDQRVLSFRTRQALGMRQAAV
jgi:hypothetical protein